MTDPIVSSQSPTSGSGRHQSRCDAALGWIQSHPARVLLLEFGLIAVALTVLLAVRGTLGASPSSPDAFDYDNLGFNLAHGQGFRFDWENPEWRRPYDRDPSNRLQDILSSRGSSWRRGSWSTALRPPLLPLLIAGNHFLFGRQLVTVRIGNTLFIAGAVCLAAALAMRLIGPLGAVIVPILGMADRGMLVSSETILTESLALFAVVLLTWLLARLLDRPSPGNAGLAGAALGFAVISRSIFILWYPLVLLLVFVLLRRGGRPSKSKRQTLILAAVFLGAAVALPTPWWVRNCVLLEAFMPLGTQGGIGLPGGYSDVAWRSGHGRWVSPFAWGLYDPLMASGDYRTFPGHLQERELARFGARRAFEWISRNPEKLPVLVWWRLRSLIRPRNVYELILLGLAFGGLLLERRRPLAVLLASVVVLNALAFMAAWSGGGRFLIPVKGSLYVLAAVGLVGLGRGLASHTRVGQRS